MESSGASGPGEPGEPGGSSGPGAPGEQASLLRKARQERGWSVKGLAARLSARVREDTADVGKSSNVTPPMVREWERGYPDGCRPQTRHREALCALYGKTEAELGIDRASWPWPRRKPARAPSRPRRGLTDQTRTRYDPGDHAASGWNDVLSQVGLVLGARATGEGTDMERERFLQAMVALGVGAAVEGIGGGVLSPADLFDYFASGPDSVNRVLDASSATDGTLADLEALSGEFWAVDKTGFTAANAALLVPMRAHLTTILGLISRPEQPAARRRLCVQAAQMNYLLRNAAVDLGFSILARRYNGAAFKAACQAEEPALCAQVLSGAAALEAGSFEAGASVANPPPAVDSALIRARSERALDLLGQARTVGGKGTVPWTLAQIRVQEAQAYASLGRASDAEESLDAGERAIEQGRPDDRPFSLVYHDSARFAASKGRTYLRLGMPALAQLAFRESLDLHGAAKNISRTRAQLTLTLIDVQLGRLDAALEEAATACRLASEMRVTNVRVDARELRRALAPHRHLPDMAQLDHQLRDLAA